MQIRRLGDPLAEEALRERAGFVHIAQGVLLEVRAGGDSVWRPIPPEAAADRCVHAGLSPLAVLDAMLFGEETRVGEATLRVHDAVPGGTAVHMARIRLGLRLTREWHDVGSGNGGR